MDVVMRDTQGFVDRHRVAVGADPSERADLRRLGFWSAVATAALGVGYGMTVIVMVVSSLSSGEAASGWQGIASYRATFRPGLLLPLIPSLLLAPAFAALMACVHIYAAPAKRIWSAIALAYTVIYAGMAFTNYVTQLVSIQRALAAGETDGLAMLVHGNPHALFWSLVSAYIFMNLAMLFAVPVFSGGGLERRIRRLFLLNGLSVIVTIAGVAADNPAVFMIGSLVIWCPLFTAATALLAVLFSRMEIPAR